MSYNVPPTYANLSTKMKKELQASNNAIHKAMTMSSNTKNSANTNWRTRMRYKKEFPELATFIKTLNNKNGNMLQLQLQLPLQVVPEKIVNPERIVIQNVATKINFKATHKEYRQSIHKYVLSG